MSPTPYHQITASERLHQVVDRWKLRFHYPPRPDPNLSNRSNKFVVAVELKESSTLFFISVGLYPVSPDGNLGQLVGFAWCEMEVILFHKEALCRVGFGLVARPTLIR